MHPPEFLALKGGKQFPMVVVPEFLAKFSAKSSLCHFPINLHILIESFNEVFSIIDAANCEVV